MQEQRHLFGSVGTRSTHLHLLAVWTFSVTSGTRTLRTAIPLTFSLLSWLPILLPPICFSPRTCVKLMLCNKFQSPNLGGGQQQVIDRYIDVLIWNVRARQTQNRYLLFLVTWRAKTYKHNLTTLYEGAPLNPANLFHTKTTSGLLWSHWVSRLTHISVILGSGRFRLRWLVTVRLGFCFVIGLKATHLCSCYRHQSMWKWVVNTSLFTQHSFIFLWDAKGCTYTKRHQMRGIGRFEHLKWSVLSCRLCSEMSQSFHTHTHKEY